MTRGKKGVVWALVAALMCGIALVGGPLYDTAIAADSSSQTQIFETVTPKEASSLIKNNSDFVILDVRTAKEFASGHIEDAINIDFYSRTFLDDLDRLDKTKTYLVYCRSGSRSTKAFNLMKKIGFQKVYGMEGGIIRWQAEGLPTTK